VLISLEPGQKLGDHQVHEHAWMVVVKGHIQVSSGTEQLDAGPGTLVRFEENERHRVSSADGGRILLVLAPWPGPGHYRGDPSRAAG
jgi:mannose-6-phosphate isomerase-like protein (cupin superfamily)